MSRFIGIDFSGGSRPWRETVARPTVWLAYLRENSKGISLEQAIPVQQLAGNGSPFGRLVSFLSAGQYEAAAIDAPFSLPLRHLPTGGHAELLQAVRMIPNAPDREFPLGMDIVCLGEKVAPKTTLKPLRETERYWSEQNVTTRSTMWSGPRGGAPFTAACLRLLDLAARPIWPWQKARRGILCEAFPAAQLSQWKLPHRAYSRTDQFQARLQIINRIKEKASITANDERKLMDNVDALDAVLAAFAAVAVAKDQALPSTAAGPEGLIAVAK